MNHTAMSPILTYKQLSNCNRQTYLIQLDFEHIVVYWKHNDANNQRQYSNNHERFRRELHPLDSSNVEISDTATVLVQHLLFSKWALRPKKIPTITFWSPGFSGVACCDDKIGRKLDDLPYLDRRPLIVELMFTTVCCLLVPLRKRTWTNRSR